MKYKINASSSEPAYLQLYRQIRSDITEGIYAYGDRLPSKRMLAEDTGTSVITTEHSYALLEAEGYIEARQRSGYYVCYEAAGNGSAAQDFSPFHISAAGSDYHSNQKQPADAFPFSSVSALNGHSGPQTDVSASSAAAVASSSASLAHRGTKADEFPFSVYARTIRKVLSEYGERILEKAPANGCTELRSALADYLARSRGIRISPDQILIGSGSEYLYSLIAQLLGRNRTIALEDPSYDKIRKVYEANGLTCEFLKMGSSGIESTELSGSQASVLHVTPFHSYPSGVTADASKRQEYIRWALNRHGLIVEDDYDSEFTMSTKPEDTLFSLEPTHTVIYMNTFTRTISSSVRIGYMVLPSSLAGVLFDKISFYSCTVPVFDQLVLAEFIRNGDFERHINRVRRRMRKERHLQNL